MIKKARISKPNTNEILMYLGYRGQEITADIKDQIKRCTAEALSCCNPRLVYKILPVYSGQIDTLPLEGHDIQALLESSEKAVVFAATLGSEAESLLMRSGVKSMSDALIMDAALSSVIENVCDNFEEDMRRVAKSEGLYLTDRYSPGYGDLPLTSQTLLCELLNTHRRIGLTVTPNHLMIPRKSVTAIMGMSVKEPTLRRKGCEVCSMFLNCDYRKEGKICNG